MIRICLAAALSACVLVAYTTPADACGVKLTVKAPRVKKKIKKSDNPSRILLLGNPPSKLARRLGEAGHKVDVAEEPSSAKRKRYAVVVADPDQYDSARDSFPGSRVVKRSSSTRANLKQVERSLAQEPPPKRPTRVARKTPRRKPRRARPAKQPEPRQVEEKIEPDPPERVAEVDTDTEPDDSNERIEVKQRDPDPPEDTGPEPEWTEEVSFGLNRSGISARNRKLLRGNALWLKRNPGVTITIEGHTDSSGRDEYNKRLGLKRARAVRSYLVRRGVKRSRIEVVSFGEERPAYDDDGRNRRVVFVKN